MANNEINFQTTPCVALVANNEINFRSLYLHHTSLAPKPALGTTAVINWPVHDGSGQNTTVVAHAQGQHIYAGDWHNNFSLVFEVERLKGSTLQVMGLSGEEGEWAVVGGTGQFAMATGVISKRLHEQTNDGNIIELTIRAFYPPPRGSRSLVPKIGPFGGDEGTERVITEAPRRLESITVCRKKRVVIYSIEFSYIDRTGRKRTEGPWGGSGDDSDPDTATTTIPLASSEFVKEVSGTFGTYQGRTVITSLKFVTNDNRTRGPYGDRSGAGTQFSVPVQDSSVVGFFGRSSEYFLHAVGVYVHPF